MKKGFLFAFIITCGLVHSTSFAKPGALEDLPRAERDKYNSLPSDMQTEALQRLKNIKNYDPDRMHIDNTGHFFIVDDSLEKIYADHGMAVPLPSPYKKKVISDNPPSGYTPEGIPIFHSYPGSPYVIYLNFLGGTISNTFWNDIFKVARYSAKPYMPAYYNPNQTPGFPLAVQNAIAAIWSKVTEDYAPWQVDVTTEPPSSYTATTAVALITSKITTDGQPMPYNTAGGVASLGGFGFSDYSYYSPALIYYDNLGNGFEEYVADAVSHEIGHNLELSHDGTINGTEYWLGAGSGEISWGCIMGAPYGVTIGKFCNGDYPNANNQEDQVAIISESIPPRNPSAGNSIGTATSLSITNGTFKFSGIIENYTTSDFFSLKNVGGTITINAKTFRSKVDGLGNNVCLSVRLLDSVGTMLGVSSNPLSCSATLTVNGLPVSNYVIQVYPVGNTVTPFSVYGSMGQYDLTGNATSTSGTLKLLPAYTTLALNSTLSFDANDTVHVSGGTPPYTYTATLNSFARSGTTSTYNASKPGLDTITVTDSRGNTASAKITVSFMDFGGMYGYSKIGNYSNPITGALSCPTGYTARPIMGTFNVDYPLFYCYRMHINGLTADYDFGGIYSSSGTGLRPNSVTGTASCPNGYSTVQVYGENSHSPDYPAYFCYKRHDETVPEAASFAGMYAPAYNTFYNNPATGGQSCPSGTVSTLMLGTYNVDYEFHFCTYPITSIRLSPQYTNLALNNTMLFDANDTVQVSGGVPPYTYSAVLGTFSHTGTTFTYTASKPGLDTLTVTDSIGHSATAKVTVAFMDFGGMYGYGAAGNFNNPTTGTLGCPSGYSSQQVFGTTNVDYPLYYCYRMHTKAVPANYDFGGMYSSSSSGLRVNPITNAASCPSGYTSVQVLGESNNIPDYPVYMCYKVHNEATAEAVHFAGMYGYGYYGNFKNPATNGLSCPTGWIGAMMLGTYNVDYPFYFCF